MVGVPLGVDWRNSGPRGEKTSDGHVAQIPGSPGGGGARTDVIAPPPGELFPETNDNSVAFLLTYGTARILLAGDAAVREEEYMRAVPARGLKRSSGFRSTKRPELRLRALLTADGSRLKLGRA